MAFCSAELEKYSSRHQELCEATAIGLQLLQAYSGCVKVVDTAMATVKSGL